MTNHDKHAYRGPESVRLRKTPPKPWELELDRDNFKKAEEKSSPPPLLAPKQEKIDKVIAIAANAGLKVSFISRTDA
jgi:hypothetical protein